MILCPQVPVLILKRVFSAVYLVSLFPHFALCVGDFTVDMAPSAVPRGCPAILSAGRLMCRREEILALDKLPQT